MLQYLDNYVRVNSICLVFHSYLCQSGYLSVGCSDFVSQELSLPDVQIDVQIRFATLDQPFKNLFAK